MAANCDARPGQACPFPESFKDFAFHLKVGCEVPAGGSY
jgi:hypothetical protein